jgi:hypothetical protein
MSHDMRDEARDALDVATKAVQRAGQNMSIDNVQTA